MWYYLLHAVIVTVTVTNTNYIKRKSRIQVGWHRRYTPWSRYRDHLHHGQPDNSFFNIAPVNLAFTDTYRVVTSRTRPNCTSWSIIHLTQYHFGQDNCPAWVPACSNRKNSVGIPLARGVQSTYLLAADDEYIPAPNLSPSKSILKYR